MRKLISALTVILLIMAASAQLFAIDPLPGNRAPVGGGTTKAGLRGEYYANTNFEGKPAFTRRDVRINFEWKEGIAGKGLPVGGATSPGMADFPTDNFSIRWTGQIVPRFSETYTLRITGKDGVRFKMRPENGEWKTLIDSISTGVTKEVSAGALKSGMKYDIVFEYVDKANTKASEAKLEWSGPGTPWEIIDPLSFAQICGHQASPGQWLSNERADRKRESVNWGDLRGLKDNEYRNAKNLTDTELDENGWPVVNDFMTQVNHEYAGKYMVKFTGKANVEVGSMYNTINTIAWSTAADGTGETYKLDKSKGKFGRVLLPKGAGYDQKTNTTTGWFTLTAPIVGMVFFFTDSEITPEKPGIKDLQILNPIANGSNETHQPGEIIKREAKATFDNFVVNRLHIGMSQNIGWKWQDRTLPAYHAREHRKGWGYCLEEYIMIVNDSGMDWHICYGAGWDEDFMRNFAKLIRYGSDGVNPYDHYVENPKYPPLNPNLRVYLEHSNELPWAVYPGFIWDDLKKKAAENHPDWSIVNYDGKVNPSDGIAMFRYHALRMKQMSDAFRTVYADVPGAVGNRARVYCFGQYDGGIMNTMLQFLDTYFNNGDGKKHVDNPHPPGYYIWGGGGAIYYGCSNKFGFMEKELMTNGGFEDVDIPTGTAKLRPEDTGWKFTGNSGICDVRVTGKSAVTVKNLPKEPTKTLDKEAWYGYKFTVGDKDLFVYKLGRWMSKEYTGTNFWVSPILNMAIIEDNGDKVAGFLSSPRYSTFKTDQFGYEWCAGKAGGQNKTLPAYLQAGKTYYLVTREKVNGADKFFGPVDVDAAAGITISAAATSIDGKKWEETPGSISYGPVDMIFTAEKLSTADGNVGLPPDASEAQFIVSWSKDPSKQDFKFGTQCAFLQGGATMTRDFTVDKAGAYWITLNTAADRVSNGYKRQSWGGWTVARGGNTIRIKIDGVDMTPGLLPIGGYESRYEPFHYCATKTFKLEPGAHTISIEQVNSGIGTMFIDEVHLSSEESFYGGAKSPNFPSGGNAFGQNAATGYHKTAQAECEMAQNWGLVPCTYEGGWAVQGDFDHYGMLAWNDLRYGSEATNSELTKQALRNAFNIWCEKGGYTYAYFYPVQKNIAQTDAPLLNCVKEFNDRLSVAPNAGTLLPGTLTPEISHWQGSADSSSASWNTKKNPADLPIMNWKSWVVTSNETAEYKITVTAKGGQAELRADDIVITKGDTAANITANVKLTAGTHTIKIIAIDQTLKIEKITIEKAEVKLN